VWVTSTTEEIMKNAPQTYVITLNSPSRKGPRLWTGSRIHTLRHCSVKQIGRALMEIQQQMADLHKTLPEPRGSYSLNRAR
jgi:hypothetical protein